MAEWLATVSWGRPRPGPWGLKKPLRTVEVFNVYALNTDQAIDAALVKAGFVGPVLKAALGVKVDVHKVG